MSIPFKCPHCKKPLRVKDELAGKRAACPACKKPIVIPAPIAPPADIEAMAAAALADPVEAPKYDAAKQIEFTCVYCDEPVKAGPEMAGKQMQCPSCRQIVKVPLPKADKPKDWRDLDKKGPAAAIVNLPEQLDGAWGTEVKGRVGQAALEDAGAIEVVVEPVGIGWWIKRVLITAAALGLITLFVVGFNRKKTQAEEKTTFGGFWEWVEKLDEKKKPHPALLAEVRRLEGEKNLWDGKGKEAMGKFKSARAEATAGAKDADIDCDFFLRDLAMIQIDLGGPEEEIRAKARFDWNREVLEELKRTLAKVKTNEVKVIAIRELGTDLIARKQNELAIGMAASQYNPAAKDKGQLSPVAPQLTALILAYPNAKTKPPLPPLEPAKPAPTDVASRLGHAEGSARSGDLEQARKHCERKMLEMQDLEAWTGVAAVLLSNKDDKAAATKAAPFVAEAMKVHGGKKYPPWHTLQLCRVAFRVPDHAAAAKEMALKLPGNFKRRAQLEWVYSQLERDDGKVTMELVKDFPDPGGAARTLAWIALARHLGRDCELPSENGEEAEHREFVKIGQLVGKPRPR